MNNEDVKYPIGIQTFEDIITEGYLYVDKTQYIYEMTRKRYIFLARPRRFGKSLLTSTLRSYFEGRKELFKGLDIEKLETEWNNFPVIFLSLASAKGLATDALVRTLHDLLAKNEQRLGVEQDGIDLNTRMMNLVLNVNKKTGKRVVILIDEYDAPLLDVLHKEEELEDKRAIMRNLYSPIKDLDSILRFVFITGITKFSQPSIFSELNNLKKVSMLPEYAGVCGITEEEMLTQMSKGIDKFAQALNITKEKAIAALKDNYDGYHFSWPSPDVYNPFSLLNALDNNILGSYWFESGTPSFLVNMFRKFSVSPSEIAENMEAMAEDFDTATQDMTDITPLLYQSGYITIKDYDKDSRLYTLGIPNHEVRIGLMRSLLHGK